MPVVDGVYYGDGSGGLAAPGGFLDRLTQTADQVAFNNQQLAGYTPALQATGVPVPTQQPGLLSRLIGLGGGSAAPAIGGGFLSSLFGGASPVATQASAPAAQPVPAMPMQAPAAPAPSGGPDSNAIANLIGTTAQKYGIDPTTAIRVARSEGGLRVGVPGDGASSIGPFQLHYGGVAGGGNGGKGLGDSYTADTGFQAGDPAHLADEVDYALRYASKNGWSAFHGAAKAGIGALAGIGGAPGGGSVQPASYGQPGPQGGPMPQATAGNSQGSGASPPQLGGNPTQPSQPGPMPIATASASASPTYNGQPSPAGASASPPGGLALRGGMTKDALAAMVANPATRADGLALWKSMLTHQYGFMAGPEGSGAVLRTDPYSGTVTPVYQAPIKGIVVDKGLVNPLTGAAMYQGPAYDVKPTGTNPDNGYQTYGVIDQNTGRVQPVAPSAPQTDPNLHGKAFLDTLPPALAGQVQAVAEGRMKLPTGSGANSPIVQRLRSAVFQYQPGYDFTDTEARSDTKKDFTSGPTANIITSGNTALAHLGQLSDAGEFLTASQVPVLNAAGQAIQTQSGANTAGKQYETALNQFTDEATKFLRGSGGTEADIQAMKAPLAAANSPGQRRAAIAQVANLMRSKVNALQSRWHQGMGPNTADFPLIQPEAQGAFDRISSRWPSDAGEPGSAPTAGAPAPARPLPVASPAGSAAGGGIIDQAHAAIARGAPRAAVIERLQKMGVDTSNAGL